MKKWYYQFAVNFSWSPSIFETSSYGGKGGYNSKEEARADAIKSADERIEELIDDLGNASKKVERLSQRLSVQIESRKKLKEL